MLNTFKNNFINKTKFVPFIRSYLTSDYVELTPKLKIIPSSKNKAVNKKKLYHPTVYEDQQLVLPHQPIPDYISKPSYSYNGKIPEKVTSNLKYAEVKTAEEILYMKNAAQLAANCLKLAISLSKEGISTEDIDKNVHEFIIKHGAYPSAVNFHGFPKSMCASPNEVVCHGLPNTRILQKGDIISYDCTVYLNGYHGDCAATVGIGEVDPEIQRLMDVAYESLWKGIQVVKPGVPINQIGKAIEEYVKLMNFSVVPEFCGHFIGKEMHMPPLVPHINQSQLTIPLKVGQIFTIEPVICQGSTELICWNDTWTIVTSDNGRCAQFEHTVLVTPDGYEILTL